MKRPHVFTALGLGILLAGCGEPADAGALIGPGATTPTATATAHAGNCVIEADGRVWLDGPCEHAVNGPGSIILNSGADETGDYAYLDRVSETQATGSWSGGGGAAHAHSPLGDLTREGDSDCWASDIGRVCLSPSAAADFGVPPAQ